MFSYENLTNNTHMLSGWENINEDCLIVEYNCEGIICANGGLCIDLYDDFDCQCQPGYTGKLVVIAIINGYCNSFLEA